MMEGQTSGKNMPVLLGTMALSNLEGGGGVG